MSDDDRVAELQAQAKVAQANAVAARDPEIKKCWEELAREYITLAEYKLANSR